MITETHTAEWYDAAYLEYPPYADTPMRHMYEQVAKLIPRLAPVVDLGCGSGYLASALLERDYQGKYIGYDFSPVAVDIARAVFTDLATPNYENLKLWPLPYEPVQLELWDYKAELQQQYQFEVVDLYEWYPEATNETHSTVYTCFEVLEHVPDDCDIVGRVPARSRFIFSVPNYWSRSHIRTYDSVGVAYDRFSNYLKYKAWYIFPTKQPEAAIHLYDTYRRADKW